MFSKNHNLSIWGVYLVVFFLPVYLIRADVFGVPTTALEIGIYALFALWLSQNIASLKNANWKQIILRQKLLAAGIFLLMTGVILSSAFSSALKTSFGIFKGWFLDPFLFFLVFVSAVNSSREIADAVKSFFLSGFAVSIISLLYWFGFLTGGVSYDGRLHGFYSSPNHLAMYLTPALIAGVFILFCLTKNRAQKTLLLISLAVISVSLYFTYSYAAWSALAASLALPLYLFAKKLPPVKKALLLAACGLLLLVLFFSQINIDKFKNLRNLSYRSSLNSRLMIWRAAWLIGKEHPFLGIGPGNFQTYYLNYQPSVPGAEPYLEWAVPQPHNIFLAFWLEAGILGLLGFILLLVWFFAVVMDNFPKNRALPLLLFSLMAYMLIHGLVDTTYWKNDLSMVFWTILGLEVVLSNKNVFPKPSTGY